MCIRLICDGCSQNNQKVVLTGIQYHFGPGAETGPDRPSRALEPSDRHLHTPKQPFHFKYHLFSCRIRPSPAVSGRFRPYSYVFQSIGAVRCRGSRLNTAPLELKRIKLESGIRKYHCLPALPALARCAFDGTLRSTSPSRCSCSSASMRFDRCPSCPSSSTTTKTRCARWQLLQWPHRPLQQMRERGRASPANVKSGWPGPIPKCHACIGPPHRPRPARTRARTIARTTARTTARTRGLVRLHKCPRVFTPGTRMRARYGG